MDYYNRILFPVINKDASLDKAISIARENNAHLTILYTYRLNKTELAKNDEKMSIKKQTEMTVRQEFEELHRQELQDAQIRYEIRYELGFVSDRLKHSIPQQDIDLLLLSGMDFDGEKLDQEDLANLDVKIEILSA